MERALRDEDATVAKRSTTVEALIAATDLPIEVRRVILDVVRRCRLRRHERFEVARELAAHFLDALRAGVSPGEAVAQFGDPVAAAKLLRRAVHRKRGPFARACAWTARGTAIAAAIGLVLYGSLAIRFFARGPTISVDSLAALRAITPGTGHDARAEPAWPLYRSTLAQLYSYQRSHWQSPNECGASEYPLLATRRGSPAWNAASIGLTELAALIARLREAAARPALGIEYGQYSEADQALLQSFGVDQSEPSMDARWTDSLVAIRLPYLAPMQDAARWLAADALHAAAGGDGARAVANLEAMVGVARQTRRPLLIDQLVALAILARTADVAQEVLANDPQAFSDSDLKRLALALRTIDRDQVRVSFEGERIGFQDLLQRVYSDDGSGDGQLIANSLALGDLAPSAEQPTGSTLARLLAPAVAITAPSRREVAERFDEWMRRSDALAAKDPWEWTEDEALLVSDGVREEDMYFGSAASLLGGWSLPLPSAKVIRLVPMVELRIGVTRIATALVRHHNRHGDWPANAASLDPEVRAEMGEWPLDPYDGKPVRYGVRDGEPVVWSIGPDRIDQSLERVVQGAAASLSRFVLASDGGPQLPGGDLLLWPRHPDHDPEGSGDPNSSAESSPSSQRDG